MKCKKRIQTVFICLNNSTVFGVANSLPKLVANTPELSVKSYYYYYRKLNGGNEVTVVLSDMIYKIVKIDYAK